MKDVATKPLGFDGPFTIERMGDPQQAPGQADYLKVLVFPYPTPAGAPATFASWPTDGQNPGAAWTAKATPDETCYFQVTEKGNLHAERSGPLLWIMDGGLV